MTEIESRVDEASCKLKTIRGALMIISEAVQCDLILKIIMGCQAKLKLNLA
jgi:hypothetical protein